MGKVRLGRLAVLVVATCLCASVAARVRFVKRHEGSSLRAAYVALHSNHSAAVPSQIDCFMECLARQWCCLLLYKVPGICHLFSRISANSADYEHNQSEVLYQKTCKTPQCTLCLNVLCLLLFRKSETRQNG